MASDRPVVFTSPQTAGDQKPFGSTIAEWHLATAGLEIGGASAWLYGVSTGILEVGAVSALGSTMVLAVGVAVLVVATLEALGMPVPDKTVQIITDLSGGPSSLVGGVIGAGLNGQNGLEQCARLVGILDLAMRDRDAVSAF